jgi:hypothetical protein
MTRKDILDEVYSYLPPRVTPDIVGLILDKIEVGVICDPIPRLLFLIINPISRLLALDCARKTLGRKICP